MLNSTQVKKYKPLLPLLLILVLASFLRLWHLGQTPISLFGDEVDVGYHAWSLWTTGRDYMGQLLPTYIHSLSEWRAPLLMYWVAPFVGILKPSNFSVRLPVAIMGIANVWLLYLVTRKLTKNNGVSLVAALLLAITPWHIHYSRATFEVTLLLSLILLGTYWFLKALDNLRFYYLAFIPFVLTFYTYSTANVFTPLLILGLCLIYHKQIRKQFKARLFITLILPTIIALPIVYQLFFGAVAGRFKLISIFSDPKVVDSVILARTKPWSNPRLDPLFHNKVAAYTQTFVASYLQSFSTEYLFLNGDPNYRQGIGNFGELLIVISPFLLIGFAWTLQLKKPENQLLIYWSLIAPIPSALTQNGGNHATRLFVLLPVLTILTAIGLVKVYEVIKYPFVKILFTTFISTLVLLNFINYWYAYTGNYRYDSSKMWNYGYESLFHQLNALNLADKNIYINNTYAPSLIHFAFHTQLSPKEFQREFAGDNPDMIKTSTFSGYKFGNQFYFGQTSSIDNLIKLLKPGDIYVAVQGKEVPGDWDWSKTPPQGLKTLGYVNDVYGNKLFYIVTKL